VPKAVNHSGFNDKHSCPQRDLILSRALQSGMLPLDHCDLYVPYVRGMSYTRSVNSSALKSE